MKFLALIIVLILRQIRDPDERLQQDDWFRRWQQRVSTWGIGGAGRLAMAIIPALLVAQILLDELRPVLFGLLWIVVTVLLLLYALGRGDLQQKMERYRGQCRAEDFEGAYLGTLKGFSGTEMSDDPQSLQEVHRLVQREFFYEGYQRWFPVLFYFVIFGPVGALAYRLLHLCRDSLETALVERCIFLADWLPARLLAVTFTLVGDFVSSRDALFEGLADMGGAPDQLLYDVGTAAQGAPTLTVIEDLSFGAYAARQNEDTGKLLSRSATCWVAIIALLVVLG